MLQGCSEQPSSAPVAENSPSSGSQPHRAVPICCCPLLSPDAGCPPPRCHSADTELRARGRISPTETGFLLLFLAGVARRLSCAFSEFADRRAWLLTAGSSFSSGALGPDKAGALNGKQRGILCLWDTGRVLTQTCKEPSCPGETRILGSCGRHPSKPSCCPSHTPRDTDPAGSASPRPPPPPPQSHSYLLSHHGGGTTTPGMSPALGDAVPAPRVTRSHDPPLHPCLPRRRPGSPRARQR